MLLTALVTRLLGVYTIPGSTKGEVMGRGSNRSGWLQTWKWEGRKNGGEDKKVDGIEDREWGRKEGRRWERKDEGRYKKVEKIREVRRED